MASLVVDLDTSGRALRLLVRGDVDLVSHEQLREALNIAVAGTQPRPIEVDLSGVTFLDATGVGIMVAAYNSARRQGLTLRVGGAAGIVRRVLEITGAAGVLVGGAHAYDVPDARGGDPVPKRRWLFARRRRV